MSMNAVLIIDVVKALIEEHKDVSIYDIGNQVHILANKEVVETINCESVRMADMLCDRLLTQAGLA